MKGGSERRMRKEIVLGARGRLGVRRAWLNICCWIEVDILEIVEGREDERKKVYLPRGLLT